MLQLIFAKAFLHTDGTLQWNFQRMIIVSSSCQGIYPWFCSSLRDDCILYKCDNFYVPQVDGDVSIRDDSLGIDWQIPTENAIFLSEKDMKHKLLKEFDSPFSIDVDLYPEFNKLSILT